VFVVYRVLSIYNTDKRACWWCCTHALQVSGIEYTSSKVTFSLIEMVVIREAYSGPRSVSRYVIISSHLSAWPAIASSWESFFYIQEIFCNRLSSFTSNSKLRMDLDGLSFWLCSKSSVKRCSNCMRSRHCATCISISSVREALIQLRRRLSWVFHISKVGFGCMVPSLWGIFFAGILIVPST